MLSFKTFFLKLVLQLIDYGKFRYRWFFFSFNFFERKEIGNSNWLSSTFFDFLEMKVGLGFLKKGENVKSAHDKSNPPISTEDWSRSVKPGMIIPDHFWGLGVYLIHLPCVIQLQISFHYFIARINNLLVADVKWANLFSCWTDSPFQRIT